MPLLPFSSSLFHNPNSSSKAKPFLLFFSRFLCSVSIPKLNQVKKLCYRHRPRAFAEARRALTDYLHSTRALPFFHAELIVSHSPSALAALLAQVPFLPDAAPADFPRTLRRFLAYRPVNEFDFFFESIGLPVSPNSAAAAHRGPFLSDDRPLLAAVSALAHFGFPWTRLGLLYSEEPTIFSSSRGYSDRLLARLRALEARGFRRLCVIGVCLAFPSFLAADADPGGEIDLLCEDLKRVFVDFELAEFAGNNVDVFLQISRRIRVFYDVGAPKGRMGELIGRNRRLFVELDEASLAQKLNFFTALGMTGEEAGPFLLRHPKIFDLDLENPKIAMPGYLRCIGLCKEDVASLRRKYPYVMGRNRLGNLPGAMRAMDLHGWFLSNILNGNYHYLSQSFVESASYDEKMEGEYLEELERIKSMKKEQFVDNKLEFLLGIGFGENKITARAVSRVNSTKDQLQERFECLLGMGIEYSMLCRMISASPKLLNQRPEMLREKVNFLCNDLSCSLEYLDSFPAFLCFDLENRIKPRYRILNWLKEHGLLKKPFAPATVLANSEKRFMVNLYSVHPAAPKQWLEHFASRICYDGSQRNLFLPRPDS